MKATSRKRAGFGALLAAILAVLMVVALAPARAFADEVADALAYSVDDSGARTYYATVEEARTAGYDGATIVMNKDWELPGTFEVEGDQSITIDMNGYKMTNAAGTDVLLVSAKANLTLKSSTATYFAYTGYYGAGTPAEELFITSGGLVTGTSSGTAAIQMDAYSTLTLDGVAIAGNKATSAGAIYAGDHCTVNMKNNAQVTHNASRDAAGIHFGGACTLNMDHSHIDLNFATGCGGGVYVARDNFAATLESGSTVNDNFASNGAGFYFGGDNFKLESVDGTGKVDNNKATDSAAGILAEGSDGTIKGLEIGGNEAQAAAGGIQLSKSGTTVSNCTIENNWAGGSGAGVYVDAKNCTIDGCSITRNRCDRFDYSSFNGCTYEGGGVYVDSMVDLKLAGKCTITDNLRGMNDTSDDDLFLQDGVFSHAYILGGASAGSRVGIRTGCSGERVIGKKLSQFDENAYFMDIAPYYVTHEDGSDQMSQSVLRLGQLIFDSTAAGID